MTTPDHIPPELARYSRQVLCAGIGVEGQRRLRHAAATVIGCGALGSVAANALVRAGIGYLRLIDRDFVELDNLHRQVLFDERDVAENLPKAEAAARKLRRVNSATEVEAVVADLNPRSADTCLEDAELLLDGTDNLETRYLVNDYAVKHNLPWVFGACLGAEGRLMAVLPGRTACLRCIWPEPPAPGELPTCDTAGVLGPTVSVVASLQALEAMKILMGREAALLPGLTTLDVWTGRMRTLNVQSARDAGDCPCCVQRRYEFLDGQRSAATSVLCGRSAVQILPAEATTPNFRSIAGRLPAHMRPTYNEFLLKFRTDRHAVTLFADGRAIVQGTDDPAVARTVLAKYVGI